MHLDDRAQMMKLFITISQAIWNVWPSSNGLTGIDGQ